MWRQCALSFELYRQKAFKATVKLIYTALYSVVYRKVSKDCNPMTPPLEVLGGIDQKRLSVQAIGSGQESCKDSSNLADNPNLHLIHHHKASFQTPRHHRLFFILTFSQCPEIFPSETTSSEQRQFLISPYSKL